MSDEATPGVASEEVDGEQRSELEEAVALDEDSPAQIQRVFIILMLVGGVVCLLPRQYISAAVLFGVALLMLGIRLSSRFVRSAPTQPSPTAAAEGPRGAAQDEAEESPAAPPSDRP